jgi:uncharacterized protein (TIGR03118 family)
VPSRFIFATMSGEIRGWPMPPPLGTETAVGADSSKWGAVYTGLAIAGEWLYATDFVNGHVDIFNNKWKLVKKHGAFTDPFLPKGYLPFGIQAIRESIFVTYAKSEEAGEEEVGAGLGIVDQYSLSGELLHRVATRGKLNAPWGVAWAPAKFGKASGALLVGNFGDGRINVFRQDKKGRWKKAGQLLGSDRKPIWVDGLWGIGFGNDAAAGPSTSLYFAAGPEDEKHGLYGSITADTP